MAEIGNAGPDARDADAGRELDLNLKGLAPSRHGRSNRQLAAAAGISERHFYRLRKNGCARSPAAERLYEQMVGGVAIAEILTQLGHKELVGTSTHAFLDRFTKAMTHRLAELSDNLPMGLEPAVADRVAAHSVEQLRRWCLAQNEIDFRVR